MLIKEAIRMAALATLDNEKAMADRYARKSFFVFVVEIFYKAINLILT